MSEPAPLIAPGPLHCWQCGSEVPAATYCVVCGHGLAEEAAAHKDAGRFRANPDERTRSVAIISTLFPQLPRADFDVFRIALALGTALVVVLTLLELFPLAVAVAAAVVPILVVVYVYEVDVYEDEPALVLAATLAWGAVTGIGAGLLARSLTMTQLLPRDDPSAAVITAAVGGVLQLLLIVLGPVALLRYRRFNDVLDGATFGVTSGAAFACTYTLVLAVDLFSSGLRPGGEAPAWLLTTVNVALLRPLLLAGTAGAVCAALWLWYRAPERDRRAMGVLGQPLVAFAVGCALLVASGLSGVILGNAPATAIRLVLAAVALLWLRQAIHLGLRQEAAEIAIGPAIQCANCGLMTPSHSFCAHCGVSLRALPKVRRRAARTVGQETP